MTVKKSDEDMMKPAGDNGPVVKGDGIDEKIVATLKRNYPKAREIEKLASGNYAVRFRSKAKKTVYWRAR